MATLLTWSEMEKKLGHMAGLLASGKAKENLWTMNF